MRRSGISLPFTAAEAEGFLASCGYDASYRGDEGVSVRGFSDPGDYVPGNAVWLGASKYLNLKEGQSREDVTLLFASPDFDALADFPSVMVCQDPRNAFMSLVEACVRTEAKAGVHETAVVGDGASLGKGVYVGPHAVIEDGAVVGGGTQIEAGCVIRGCVRMGERCRVFPNCSIGSDGYGFRKGGDGTLRRLPHLGLVVIGDDVEVGAGSVIDRGTFRDTVIGSGSKLDSMTMIGHNAHVGRNCLVIGGTVGGNSTVEDGCELIHGTVKNRVRIGERARVGIGSVVLRDVDGGSVCFGNPARVIAGKAGD